MNIKVDKSAPLAIDAINMLITDHCEVEECFRVFARTPADKVDQKKQLLEQICKALRLHMTIEEEIFYPAVRETVFDAKDIVWAGVIEHDKARELIYQLEAMKCDEPSLNERVGRLAAIIAHHVREEENVLFPQVINSALDGEEVGKKMLKRKAELSHAIEAQEPMDAGAVSS
ncbi:MAG: hemerythrin domain-containing protein [Pseudomonadota bacterium]